MGQKEDRAKESEAIITSTSPKIVILAGPGCGKTYTFEKLLKANSSTQNDSLAITFINELVGDLHNKLDDLAEVKTFHALAHKILRHNPTIGYGLTTGFRIYQDTSEFIVEDWRAIKMTDVPPFVDNFRNASELDDQIRFYLNRCAYYDSAGQDDLVYRVVLGLRNGAIEPLHYKVIVVDEFQDFNALDVEFIETVLHADKTLLIVGDDDQAIYAFRNAHPKYLRDRTGGTGYKLLPLSFCSRCTTVIVEATKQVALSATRSGHFINRIGKPFECYLPDKGTDSESFPKIIHAHCSVYTPKAPYLTKYIDGIIKEIQSEEIDLANSGSYPPVLIIGKTHYLKQINAELTSMGYKTELNLNKKDPVKNLFYGLSLLSNKEDDNLGWRIVLEYMDTPQIEILKRSEEADIATLLDKVIKETWLKIVELSKTLMSLSEIDESNAVLHEFCHLSGLSKDEVKKYIVSTKETAEVMDQSGMWIKLTTHFGAKGLSGGRVFIVDFNDGDFPKNPRKISDVEISNFIIDLTRTRKECHLVSNGRFGVQAGIQPSSFINWINSELIQRITVDKTYFEARARLRTE